MKLIEKLRRAASTSFAKRNAANLEIKKRRKRFDCFARRLTGGLHKLTFKRGDGEAMTCYVEQFSCGSWNLKCVNQDRQIKLEVAQIDAHHNFEFWKVNIRDIGDFHTFEDGSRDIWFQSLDDRRIPELRGFIEDALTKIASYNGAEHLIP